jgi:hypothetical protein
MQITPLHCRVARLLLEWHQTHLVDATKLSIITIRRFEGGSEVSDKVRDTIRRALEKAGAVFFFPGDRVNDDLTAETGVVLRKKRTRPPPV